jgi:hypothetical protein
VRPILTCGKVKGGGGAPEVCECAVEVLALQIACDRGAVGQVTGVIFHTAGSSDGFVNIVVGCMGV